MGDTRLLHHLTAAAEHFRTKSGGAIAAPTRNKGNVQARTYDYSAAQGRKEEVKRWVVVTPEYPKNQRKHRETVVAACRNRPRKWEVASHIRHSSAFLSSVRSTPSQAHVTMLSSHDTAQLLHQSSQACSSLSRHIHVLTQSLQLAIQHFEA